MPQGTIRIRGARQHNLKNIDLDIRTNELTVVTGPSGSGKSSLVFDTLFAEGQRRYVETFSAYARQFLDRMDKPAVDKVEGVPPAIAIDQTNPVRSSRSTVGTMTELNDHLKLLYARAAQLFDRQTTQAVRHDSPESIYAELMARTADGDPRVVMTFPVELPGNTSAAEVEQWLSASGFTRVHAERDIGTPAGPHKLLDVVADRFRLHITEKIRAIEAIETALKRGGRLNVYVQNTEEGTAEEMWRFSTGLHCPDSDLRYTEPTPSLFSFNSAMGACETCKGFGRVIGVDYGLVIPNDKLTLRAGAVKVMQTPAWKEAQDDLMRHAEAEGIPRDTPWYKLTPEQQAWVINGSPGWKGKWNQHWFGIKRFFAYLESKAYKMHIRVLLSKYRSYTTCDTCGGARLKLESLQWRLGTKAAADAVLPSAERFLPVGVQWTREQLEAMPGLCLHDLMRLPIDKLQKFFNASGFTPSPAGGGLGWGPAGVDRLAGGGAGAQAGSPHPSLPPAGEVAIPEEGAHAANANASPNPEAQALKSLFEEIRTRVKYLCDVGIGYLTLDRQSRTLSGGEVQRINLTTALGTSLVNTLFVLDEPSIGLHPRDMNRITQAMRRLVDAGNTLVVVEHDPAVMLAADRMIDMGPGPGEKGGRIVFDGTPEELKHADTLTGAYLGARKQVGMGLKRAVTDSTPRLILEGARDHNLQNLTIEFPLQRLVCVTGVSGSGKSTLMQDILAPALLRQFGKATETPGLHDRLLGADQLTDMVFVDQSPIGKTARSNPASYVGAWDAVRELFALAPMAQQRSYTATKFSFNNGDGRCPTCGGS
ncbi:MAG: UvrA family protein, partial [Polaromonas sp.]|nr:UvrA family protein [Polaromonas sp.]